jgi:hypothetical protein
MNTALEHITVLPCNENELKEFKKQVISEMLVNPNPSAMKNQIIWGLELFNKLDDDWDLYAHFEDNTK